jgi:tetratricopeptide (TPR) repeat protein
MTMAPLFGIAVFFVVWIALRSERARLFRFAHRVFDLRDRGRMEVAVRLVQQALDQGRKFPSLVNLAVETLVASGKYSEALAIPLQFLSEGATDAVNKVLVQINLSEAEYNLGRWQQSLSRLSTLDESAAPFDIARAGLALQRAWILAHTNRPEEALSAWEQADIDGLPYRYRAEHYFTHVAVLLALDRIEEAEEAAAAGADAAVRASSERNALFILARVAARQRDWARADSLCQAAAEHRYRGQGGDGLLLWGDVLTELGRVGPARHAYELAISRDGQSESATKAAIRLGLSIVPSRNSEKRGHS